MQVDKKLLFFLAGVLLFSSVTLYFIGMLPADNDLNLHNKAISKLGTNEAIWPAHFLYFGLVFLLSGLSTSIEVITVVAAIVLGFAITLKGFFAYKYLQLPQLKIGKSKLLLFVFGLILFTNMSARPPWTHELPPITWQNSSTIFLFPFALLLFWWSYQFLLKPTQKLLIFIGVFGGLSLFIKPNFMLVFVVVFPLFVLLKYGLKPVFWKVVLVHLIFAAILLSQFYYTFEILSKQGAIENYNEVKVVIAPFKAWAKLTRSIPISFLIWAGYPLIFLGLFYQKVKNKGILNYSLAFFGVGFLIFILLNEETSTGANVGAVNFLWQACIVNYILSVVCLKEHLNILRLQQKWKWQDYITMGAFTYFAFSGIMYLINTVYLPSIS